MIIKFTLIDDSIIYVEYSGSIDAFINETVKAYRGNGLVMSSQSSKFNTTVFPAGNIKLFEFLEDDKISGYER